MVKAKIKEVRVCSVYDLWRRKPRGLTFEDTDAIVVSAKTDKGERVTETFYVCLKPDGTFNPRAISRRSRARRDKLVRFLRAYGIADTIKGYKIAKRTQEWLGKDVEITTAEKGARSIIIP